MYGNQKHNYLNAIKVEQLMAGKQLLISELLINTFETPTFETPIINKVNSFLQQSYSISTVFFLTRFQRATQLQL